jgi:hypothetical protein
LYVIDLTSALDFGEGQAKAAAESVYSGVEIRRGVAKRAGIWGNFGLCWRGSQTVGGAPDENRLNTVGSGDLGV